MSVTTLALLLLGVGAAICIIYWCQRQAMTHGNVKLPNLSAEQSLLKIYPDFRIDHVIQDSAHRATLFVSNTGGPVGLVRSKDHKAMLLDESTLGSVVFQGPEITIHLRGLLNSKIVMLIDEDGDLELLKRFLS